MVQIYLKYSVCLVAVPRAYTVEVAVPRVNMELLFVYSLESLNPSVKQKAFIIMEALAISTARS